MNDEPQLNNVMQRTVPLTVKAGVSFWSAVTLAVQRSTGAIFFGITLDGNTDFPGRNFQLGTKGAQENCMACVRDIENVRFAAGRAPLN